MSKDMMPGFELFQPATLDDAFAKHEEFGKDAWTIAGGKDSLDWFKDRVKRPRAVVDITGIGELHGIRETGDGVEIGALTTLSEIENNPLIVEKYGLLATAIGRVASPQIRNAGTIGGNLCQDTRCWYYRDGLPCYRAGGNTCYADTPKGMNREHCLFNASRCVAVTPSDTAPALVALEAQMVIRNAGGERVVEAEDFFIGPAVDIQRMTVLEPGEILTAVRIPGTWAGASYYFEKIADRNTWDFALVSVASVARLAGGKIEKTRIACGGVSCTPHRLAPVEDLVAGEPINEELAEIAGQSASRGATPLNFNHFKVPLIQNLVKRAIRSYA